MLKKMETWNVSKPLIASKCHLSVLYACFICHFSLKYQNANREFRFENWKTDYLNVFAGWKPFIELWLECNWRYLSHSDTHTSLSVFLRSSTYRNERCESLFSRMSLNVPHNTFRSKLWDDTGGSTHSPLKYWHCQSSSRRCLI